MALVPGPWRLGNMRDFSLARLVPGFSGVAEMLQCLNKG